MFRRSLIHVGGPPGGGKTAFIEAVLADRDDGAVAVVRGRRDDATPAPRTITAEDGAVDADEQRRYRAAGAMGAVEYAFAEPNADAFFMADFMLDYWTTVIFEGDDPTGLAQLTVHVTGASAGPILERRLVQEDVRLVGLLAEVGLPAEVVQLLGARAKTKIPGVKPPPPRPRWTVVEEQRGIARSQLVVVNVRGDAEREPAAALLADVARLRGDKEVFADLSLAVIGGRTPITAVAADLADRRDPGTRKALARVRRALRAVD